jgi:hypothetical protein
VGTPVVRADVVLVLLLVKRGINTSGGNFGLKLRAKAVRIGNCAFALEEFHEEGYSP